MKNQPNRPLPTRGDLIDSPCTSYWLRDALMLHSTDARLLVTIMTDRIPATAHLAGFVVTATKRDPVDVANDVDTLRAVLENDRRNER